MRFAADWSSPEVWQGASPALPEPDDYVQVPAGYTTDTWAQHLASEGSKIPWAAIGIGAAVIGFLLWRGHR